MISNLPNLHHKKSIEKTFRFNIMLAGANGLGKTTFFNNFLNKKVLSTELQREIRKSDISIEIQKMEINENDFFVKLDVIEVNGVGDNFDNSKCEKGIVDLLKERYEEYSKEFDDTIKRTVNDSRVHVCLYFFEASNFIKESDIRTFNAISQYCNVIPVVGKADMMTEEEMVVFKELFTKNLGEAEIFFVSCEKDCKTFREYNWGSIEKNAFDFFKLRELLLERNTKEFVVETEFLYDQHRMNALAEEMLEGKECLSEFNAQNQELEEIKERIVNKREMLNGN